MNTKSLESTSQDKTHPLPDGRVIYHLNKHETDFLYKEIFTERSYLKHGITFNADACVFDIGANIGMFSLFVKTECPGAQIHAFEPIPELNRILALNLCGFGPSVTVYPNGMSDTEKDATFTYYPDYSILSGLDKDVSDDCTVLAAGIRQQLAESRAKIENAPDEYVNGLVQKKLGRRVEVKCRLKTVSGMIREAKINRIDLLKIDAEKSELAILRGIQDADWPKINQVVLEVHSTPELEAVLPILQRHGLTVQVEREGQFKNAEIFNCFAIRK